MPRNISYTRKGLSEPLSVHFNTTTAPRQYGYPRFAESMADNFDTDVPKMHALPSHHKPYMQLLKDHDTLLESYDSLNLSPERPRNPYHSRELDAPFTSSRIPKLPTFTGNGEAEFEIWKYDANCLIKEGVYPAPALREAIRESLKGQARGILLHLGEHATVRDIMLELEGVYGNVQTSEKLKETFYSEYQREGESVAEYSLRLERLLSRVPELIDRSIRDQMLRNRLWSGLRDTELKNISRYLFEKNFDFNTLRKELRVVEEELRAQGIRYPKVSTRSTTHPKPKEVEPERDTGEGHLKDCKQYLSSVEGRVLQQMEAMTKQMNRLESKLGELDREVKDLRRDQRSDRRPQWRGKGKDVEKGEKVTDPGETKKESLNSKGPLMKGD